MTGADDDHSFQFLNYRGLADLERRLQDIALKLPSSIRLVVGVPRSGVLAASILALHLNLPFTDVNGYIEDRLLATGRRPSRPERSDDGRPRVVVVDDSVLSGTQMQRTREELEAAGKSDGVLYTAPFVSVEAAPQVDLFGETVEMPRAFAWNILHHPRLLGRSCVDIDGVLCLDPSDEDNDDGLRYIDFVRDAQPLFLPSAPVKYIVTSRLEKYREGTERWLQENGVRYSELITLDLPDAATRRAQGAHAKHKAAFYAQSGTDLFIESDYAQSVEIAALSGRQVFSIDRREMVYPAPMRALVAARGPLLTSVRREPPVRELRARYSELKSRGRTIIRGGPPGLASRVRQRLGV